MARVIVTGGSGKLGRACVDDLLAHKYEVVNLDVAPPRETKGTFIQIDLTDFGQVMDAFSGTDDRYSQIDGVVHLAAIPAPGIKPDHVTFTNNVLSTYNVFQAARKLGIKDVVWASSETVLGLPFEVPPPYVPVDEEYPGRPESAYSLGKLVDETIAQQFCRWDSEQKIIGLRFSNVMEPHDYARFPSFDSDAKLRKWNLWAYIDARDASQAIRKALEHPMRGYEVFIIANADSVMSRPNSDLLAEIFPDVPHQREFEPNETLLSIEKAKRILGYEPQYSWRTQGQRQA
jgi:nucleoside-diphosphate-sugar epimerase